MIVDDGIAWNVSTSYFDAEKRVIEIIKSYLVKDLEVPEYQQLKLAQIQALRAEVFQEFNKINPTVAKHFEDQIAEAYKQANALAYADIGVALTPEKLPPEHIQNAVVQIQRDLKDGIDSAQQQVFRNVEDVFRKAVAESAQMTLLRGVTREQATIETIDTLAKRGLSEFTDASGRNWTLPNYANMAVRTGTRQASIRGYEAVLDRNHLDLVVVQPGPRACSICDRWARSILTRDTTPQTLHGSEVDDLVTGGKIYVEIDGSLSDARADGFQHPNCRCRLRAYIPGATNPNILDRPPWDEEGYLAQQKQRQIENAIRKAKLAEISTDPNNGISSARVKALQAQMADHLEANPYLKRQSSREQITGRFAMPETRTAAKTARETKTKIADMTEKVKREPKQKVKKTDAENASDVADLSALKRIDPALTRRQVLQGSNPGYNVNTANAVGEFNHNCSYCVGAYEIRARGYDVIARPIGGAQGRYNGEIMLDWQDADGKTRQLTYFRDILGRDKSAKITEFTKDWEEGARGFISGNWTKGGGGHIFSVLKTQGKLVYLEPQNPSADPATVGQYLKNMKLDSLAIVRTDDLIPKKRLFDTVVEEATPERLASIEAERSNPMSAEYLRERVARIKARIADLDNVNAEYESAIAKATTATEKTRLEYERMQAIPRTQKELEAKLKKLTDYMTR